VAKPPVYGHGEEPGGAAHEERVVEVAAGQRHGVDVVGDVLDERRRQAADGTGVSGGGGGVGKRHGVTCAPGRRHTAGLAGRRVACLRRRRSPRWCSSLVRPWPTLLPRGAESRRPCPLRNKSWLGPSLFSRPFPRPG